MIYPLNCLLSIVSLTSLPGSPWDLRIYISLLLFADRIKDFYLLVSNEVSPAGISFLQVTLCPLSIFFSSFLTLFTLHFTLILFLFLMHTLGRHCLSTLLSFSLFYFFCIYFLGMANYGTPLSLCVSISLLFKMT